MLGVADQLPPLGDVLVPGGAIGAGVWLFYRLFLRADRREADAFLEVKDQRDHYRARAEEAERLLSDALADLALYRQTYGPLDLPTSRLGRRRDRAVYPDATSEDEGGTT